MEANVASRNPATNKCFEPVNVERENENESADSKEKRIYRKNVA